MTADDNKANDTTHRDPGDEDVDVPHAAVELGVWARAATSVVSLACLAAGSVAVFTSNNQAGTAVLFAGGVFGGIIALGGRLPTSIKIGDNEIKLAQARFLNAATKKIDKASPEEAGEIISSVAASAASPLADEDLEARQRAVARRLARLQSLGENYHRLVYTTLQGWAWNNKHVQLQVDQRPFDVTVTGNSKTGVEAVAKSPNTTLSPVDVERFADMVYGAKDELNHFVLVANVPLGTTAKDFWSKIPALQESNVQFIVAEDYSEIVNQLIPAIEEFEQESE
ncbi:hypothetical protein [Amycolatopsis samaneae]|uniref:Restriction endonuclease type IV Mrr domain-containing protein n=1 Tax=Amycolatopsis samaneae TaxID=664691 RepID=A0ABW5GI93_9PSEU